MLVGADGLELRLEPEIKWVQYLGFGNASLTDRLGTWPLCLSTVYATLYSLFRVKPKSERSGRCRPRRKALFSDIVRVIHWLVQSHRVPR